MAKSKSSPSAVLAVMAALLVVGGLGLVWAAWRGVRMLNQEASNARTIVLGDAASLAGHADWVGNWRGGPLKLDIDGAGHADFERTTLNSSEKLSGVVAFDGSDVVIDSFVVKKHLRIDKPPQRDGSRMVMTLDGVELERQ